VSHQEEASGLTQDSLEKLYLSAVLQTHQRPPGRSGRGGWGERGLYSDYYPNNLVPDRRQKKDGKECVDVWMPGQDLWRAVEVTEAKLAAGCSVSSSDCNAAGLLVFCFYTCSLERCDVWVSLH